MGSYGQTCGVRQKRPAIIKCLMGFGFSAVVVVTAGAAAKPPKLQDTPAMTTFRCYAGDYTALSCQAISDGTDRIRDDSNPLVGGDPYGYALARVASGGFYNLAIQPSSGRRLNLALGEPHAVAQCEPIGNCNPDRDQIVGNSDLMLDTASIQLKPLDPMSLSELPGLLWGMNCTGSYPAKLHYTFTLPSGDGHWGFNFNSVVYPGSNNAVITRASDGRHWTVESNGLIGELLSWDHSGLRRPQSGPSHEGFFYANFKFTIEVVSLPSPSVGCS